MGWSDWSLPHFSSEKEQHVCRLLFFLSSGLWWVIFFFSRPLPPSKLSYFPLFFQLNFLFSMMMRVSLFQQQQQLTHLFAHRIVVIHLINFTNSTGGVFKFPIIKQIVSQVGFFSLLCMLLPIYSFIYFILFAVLSHLSPQKWVHHAEIKLSLCYHLGCWALNFLTHISRWISQPQLFWLFSFLFCVRL